MIDIGGFLPESYIEWDGKISACIFTIGCNWKCSYCHAHTLIKNSELCKRIPIETVLAYLDTHKEWIDGVVVSGGEPTIQKGLIPFLKLIQEKIAMPVLLRTNGSNPGVIKQIFENCLIDTISLDFKTLLNNTSLSDLSGVNVKSQDVIESFDIVKESYVSREYHTTLCPSYISKDTIIEMGKFLNSDGIWVLQPYEKQDIFMPKKAGKKQFTKEELIELYNIACSIHNNVVLLGVSL